MREELGDLLLQVVLHAQMAAEAGTFTLDDVAREINEKLIRRHPHVFGDIQVSSTKEVLNNWETIKKGEKKHRKYLTDDIPEALPALFRAEKSSAAWRGSASIGRTWARFLTRSRKSSRNFGRRWQKTATKRPRKNWGTFYLHLSMLPGIKTFAPKTPCG